VNFTLHTTGPVRQDLGLLLRARQQQLKNYQHLSLLPTFHTLTPPSDEISHISCLQLYLGSERDCGVAKQLFENMPSVTSLSIKLSSARLDRTIGGKCETGRKIIVKIFDSTNASRPHQKLKRLRIERMSFKSAGFILPTVLPLDELEHLHLFRCRYTNRLCESLSQLKLRLKSYCDLRAYNVSNPGAYDTSMRSIQPLRKLRLSCDQADSTGWDSCDWASFLPHANELRCLDLRDNDPARPLFATTRRSLAGFRSFCANASHIQQLSINGPSLQENQWDMPRGMDAFLVSCYF